VSTSAHFWRRHIATCECCNESFRSAGSPCSLQDIAPGAVLRSMSERTRYRDADRFAPQVLMRWDVRPPL
jgi:hypothetical protein